MHLRTKLVAGATSVAVFAGLVALAAPAVVPLLPSQVQVVLGGTIKTVPGTAEELFERTGLGESGEYGSSRVTHADVNDEYVIAASIWPWTLPPGWGFPKNRGVADTPGQHWNGMGVHAAFSLWAKTSLEAVEAGDLAPDAANDLLDEVEDATRTLLEEGVISDRRFIEDSVTPLRR